MAKVRSTTLRGEDKWKAESDCRTLTEAESIRKDAKRFGAAQKAAMEQKAALAPILRGKPRK